MVDRVSNVAGHFCEKAQTDITPPNIFQESHDPSQPPSNRPRKLLTGRHLILLATVPGLGIAVLGAGPSGYVPTRLPVWTSSATAADATSQYPASFADLVAKVKPAVIRSASKSTTRPRNPPACATTRKNDSNRSGFADGEVFQQFGSQEHAEWRPQQITTTSWSEGSGFFISSDGHAVTNNHVVDHANSVQVTTDDGTIYKAKVIGTNPKTDLAWIKVDGKAASPW